MICKIGLKCRWESSFPFVIDDKRWLKYKQKRLSCPQICRVCQIHAGDSPAFSARLPFTQLGLTESISTCISSERFLATCNRKLQNYFYIARIHGLRNWKEIQHKKRSLSISVKDTSLRLYRGIFLKWLALLSFLTWLRWWKSWELLARNIAGNSYPHLSLGIYHLCLGGGLDKGFHVSLLYASPESVHFIFRLSTSDRLEINSK